MKYPKMNPKVKAAWLKALRSGKYRQARGSLNTSGAYCCLGVLCDVTKKFPSIQQAVEGHWETLRPTQAADYPLDYIVQDGDGCEVTESGTIPTPLRGLIGLDSDVEGRLINLNDERKFGFVAISNWVEKNL